MNEHCPIDLPTRDPYTPYVRRLTPRSYDEMGFERGRRINGLDQCPDCEVWWPCVEEPDEWQEGEEGKWIATGWWGHSYCSDCGLLLVTQPDGTPEAYHLG